MLPAVHAETLCETWPPIVVTIELGRTDKPNLFYIIRIE